MAEPQAIQKLKHGKALCGSTFGQFVETFNWLVDFCLNLKGDQSPTGDSGSITVDRSDPSAPVIRYGNKPYNGDPGGEPEDPETPDDEEPGSDPDGPYDDPEDDINDPGDGEGNGENDVPGGNDISNDNPTVGDDSSDYCNTIVGGGGGGGSDTQSGNAISSTCSH